MATPAVDGEVADAPRTPLRRLGSTRKLAAFASLRAALSEQARAVEARAESCCGAAHELADYCRRRSELEHEYSKALDKLGQRTDTNADNAVPCVVPTGAHCRALARAHAALGALYGGALASRAARAAEHAARMARRARALLLERQEELAGALLAAAAHGKAHATAATAWRLAATKLRDAHERREALLSSDPGKLKKLRALDKELDKRRTRHSEARARALRARHDHALALEEANAALQRYYLDDIADMMLCTEVGFEAGVSVVARTAAAAEACAAAAAEQAARALRNAADNVDASCARRRLLASHAAFTPPPPQPAVDHHSEDRELGELLGPAADQGDTHTKAVCSELSAACAQYTAAAAAARLQCQEAAKTLDAAEGELVRQMEGAAIDVSKLFAPGGGAAAAGAGEASVDDTPRRDQEDYYLAKVRAYVWSAGRVSRLEARAAAARAALGVPGAPGTVAGAPCTVAGVPRRAGRGLFAAPLPNDRLPHVLTGCVRVIAHHGLNNQGIFRVSGAHADVSALRAALDRGEEALEHCGPCDVNAVCTLLKLWLRSLRPPLLPRTVQQRLMHARLAPAPQVRALLSALPVSHMIALRYLCAFLAHAATRSALTRMDAWNLAICLGPTLLAAQGAPTAQVAAQNALNHLLKRLILQHEQLFPQDLLPHTLYIPPEGEDQCDNVPLPSDTPCTPCTPGHDDLTLYVDDDEESEPLSVEPLSLSDSLVVEESEPPSAWCASPSPPPAPAPAHTPPLQRAPKPHPPKRCESSLSCGAAAAAADAAPAAECAQEASPAPAQPPPDAALCRGEAPDLVLGLPPPSVPETPLAAAPDPPVPPLASPEGCGEDAADAFAHNRGTLKKRPPTHSREPEMSPDGAPSVASLVPPSEGLAPLLRPALLRRPTPHPLHTHTTALHTHTDTPPPSHTE